MDEKLTVGKRIFEAAKNQGFTKADFSKKMGIVRQTLDNWISGQTSPDQNELERASKILGVDIIQFLGIIKPKPIEAHQIPFYDAVAVGGFALLADQSAITEPTDMIEPGTFFRAATGSLRIYGHSMFPKYPAGCIVAFREADKEVIIWGEDYVVELEDRRIIKRIEKGKNEQNILAVSYNKSESYIYESVDIPVRKIKRLFMVLGKIELEASI